MILLAERMPASVEVDLPEDTIPDGGYGWVCVLACFLVNFATWGTVAVRALTSLSTS